MHENSLTRFNKNGRTKTEVPEIVFVWLSGVLQCHGSVPKLGLEVQSISIEGSVMVEEF